VLKRWRARARGRAARIHKRTCHITVTLAPLGTTTVTRAEPEAPAEEKPQRAPRRKAAPKPKGETKAEAEPKTTAAKKKTPAKKKESNP
jgi:outer membrane biosynthesis protein TonB